MKPAHEELWVLKPIWAYANAKYGSCMPRNRSKIFNVKVIHNRCNCEPLSKIGRLLTWKLFQELESAVHWSDGYIMLIGFSLWTWWYFIFWWSLIRIVCYTAVFSVVTQRYFWTFPVMGWFHRNNCAIALRLTPALNFDEGAAQENKQT